MRHAVLVLAFMLLAAAPASADYRIDGRGWGHGIGLSQYGAQGYATAEGRDFRWILGHYYRGTSVGRAPGTRMRVRLREARTLVLEGVSEVLGAGGRRVRLSARGRFRVTRSGARRIRIDRLDRARRVATMQTPVRARGRVATRLLGVAESGVRDGWYRGEIWLWRDGRDVLAVNHVGLEPYLYGVVPGEMPALWHAEALKAQAVVARSYALTSRSPSGSWDVYADTRSQVYGGVLWEVPTTTAAVRATRRLAVHSGGAVARTYFFSSSGGRTAAIEEVWPSNPVSYLESVEDPYDRWSPNHRWSVRFTPREVRRRLEDVTPGDFEDVAVVERTPSGRAATVRITGRDGERDITADAARFRLGLRSTWFSIVREKDPGEAS